MARASTALKIERGGGSLRRHVGPFSKLEEERWKRLRAAFDRFREKRPATLEEPEAVFAAAISHELGRPFTERRVHRLLHDGIGELSKPVEFEAIAKAAGVDPAWLAFGHVSEALTVESHATRAVNVTASRWKNATPRENISLDLQIEFGDYGPEQKEQPVHARFHRSYDPKHRDACGGNPREQSRPQGLPRRVRTARRCAYRGGATGKGAWCSGAASHFAVSAGRVAPAIGIVEQRHGSEAGYAKRRVDVLARRSCIGHYPFCCPLITV